MPLFKKKYILVVDVETANSLDDPIVYDIGWAIIDMKGRIYEEGSYMIAEAFCDSRISLDTAYYTSKLPGYWEKFRKGDRKMVSIETAQRNINYFIKKYNVNDVAAYNCYFDKTALNKSLRFFTNSAKRWFFPYGINYICIWNMACQLLFTQKSFQKIAEQEGWFSAKGNIQTSAEIAYRYIMGYYDFEEEHEGLDDVRIEALIFAKCIAQHKKCDRGINRLCWRIPTEYYKKGVLPNENH